ncbi:MAG: Txe/YoeB family addiction module toxin [Bacteroidales bacterium]
MYRLIFTEDAQKDIRLLNKKAPTAVPKLKELLAELKVDPRDGTGKVEMLKGFDRETWSRRINHEHRLVYQIDEPKQEVLILAAYGHYLHQADQ